MRPERDIDCALTMNSLRSELQSAVQRLATSNIFIGTSSWKYQGWCGLIYDEQRYHYRGKFAETRFERDRIRVPLPVCQMRNWAWTSTASAQAAACAMSRHFSSESVPRSRFTNAAACLRRPSARMSSRGIKSKKFALRPCCHRSKTEDVSSRLGTTKLSSRLWRTGYHGRARNPRARSSFAPAS